MPRVVLAAAVLVGMMALPSAAEPTTTVAPPTTEGSTTTAGDTATTAPPTTSPPTTLSAAEREARAAAAGNLEVARAADSEILAALLAINDAIQTTQTEIDAAQRRKEALERTIEVLAAEIAEKEDELAEIEDRVRESAVDTFMDGLDDPGVLFADAGVNETLRQTQLLAFASQTTTEEVEALRIAQDDRLDALEETEAAAAAIEVLEAELSEELALLREQEEVQRLLREEAQDRISRWESELSAYAAEDAAIQELIAEGTSGPIAPPETRDPSSLGFQWPVVGQVTSPYGYRIHPVYGTRKLHAGLDVGAPGGTPITATSAGIVIFAGWRGGYGNTVIVDHGGGVTSLYAHMSQIGIAENATVNRGDVLGLVGATGTATGNHLHFEIRVGGEPTDPAPYLP